MYAGEDSECNNLVEDVNSTDNRPILYSNHSVTWTNKKVAEVVLCNADHSTLDNITVKGSDTKKNNGFLIVRTDYATVKNSNSSNNDGGFLLYFSSFNTFTSNNAAFNNYNGFYLDSSSSNTFIGNNAATNKYGFHLSSSSNNTFTSNNVSNNSKSGIRLENSNNNTISSSMFVFNANSKITPLLSGFNVDDAGVALKNSSHNTLHDNTLNQTKDLYLDADSSDNLFYRNLFYNGSEYYIVDYNETNMFNYSYRLSCGVKNVGNYYEDISTYNITDFNGNGYGDIGSDYPYNFSQAKWQGYGADYAPMMNPNVRLLTCPAPKHHHTKKSSFGNLNISYNCTTNKLTVIVTDSSGDAVKTARVTLYSMSTGLVTGYKYTDSNGNAIFDVSAGEYLIKLSKSNYYDKSTDKTFTCTGTEQTPVTPAQPECTSDTDCTYNEYCSDGSCVPVTQGTCGYVANHMWNAYECCADSDCAENQVCTGHSCVVKEQPQQNQTPKVNPAKIAAENAIKDVQAYINEKKSTMDTTEAEKKLKEAQDAYNAGNYEQATQLANQAKSLIKPRENSNNTTSKNNQTAEKQKGNDLLLWIGGLIVLIAIGVGAYYFVKYGKGSGHNYKK